MPPHRWIWLFGAVLGVLLVVAAGWLAHSPALAILLLLASLCASGLAAEVVRGLWASARGLDRPRPLHAVPADGRVERVEITGVRALANARNPGFGRFEELLPGETASPPHKARVAPVLVGRVAILSVFLGRYGVSWSDDEIARAHEALTRAGKWLEKEAMRWLAPVNVVLASTYFAVHDSNSDPVEVDFVPEGDHRAPLEAHAASKALATFSRAAAALGFADAADMIDRISGRVKADAWVWLLQPRAAGRSLAVPPSDTPWPGVSVALCYASEASFPEPLPGPPFSDPITFAHELLHLFGAKDKYGVPLHTFPRTEVTDRDIMCLYHNSLGRMRVDPRTAAELGWS
jgi:hypothetical protein